MALATPAAGLSQHCGAMGTAAATAVPEDAKPAAVDNASSTCSALTQSGLQDSADRSSIRAAGAADAAILQLVQTVCPPNPFDSVEDSDQDSEYEAACDHYFDLHQALLEKLGILPQLKANEELHNLRIIAAAVEKYPDITQVVGRPANDGEAVALEWLVSMPQQLKTREAQLQKGPDDAILEQWHRLNSGARWHAS